MKQLASSYYEFLSLGLQIATTIFMPFSVPHPASYFLSRLPPIYPQMFLQVWPSGSSHEEAHLERGERRATPQSGGKKKFWKGERKEKKM